MDIPHKTTKTPQFYAEIPHKSPYFYANTKLIFYSFYIDIIITNKRKGFYLPSKPLFSLSVSIYTYSILKPVRTLIISSNEVLEMITINHYQYTDNLL